MGRILVAPAMALTLALAMPAVSSAAHVGKRHHGARHRGHHRHHAKGSRLLTFGAVGVAGSRSATNPSATSTPTTSGPETAGTVASFSGGVLTITLNDKTSVSGKVTEATELRCEPATSSPEVGGEEQPLAHSADVQSGDQSGEEAESGEGQQDDEEQAPQACTSTALKEGTMVRAAELSVSSAGAVWEKVELVH